VSSSSGEWTGRAKEGAEARFQESLGEVPVIFCKTADGAYARLERGAL
jgi:hypothetical protein